MDKLWADIDCAFEDFPFRDPDFPLSASPVIVDTDKGTIFGDLTMAAGPGAKGTVILTPPMGDGDDLASLIVPLTYAGIHVLTFKPRGTSREGEAYSMPKAVDDVHSIVSWIVANSGNDKVSSGGLKLRLDPSRIALCGIGDGGGNVSIAACAESKTANYVIAAAPGNPDAQLKPEVFAKARPAMRALKEATLGEVDLETWYDALTMADKARLSVIEQAPKLVDKHLLLIGAKRDTVSPIATCHEPNVRALRNAQAKHLTEVVLDTDHFFLTKRYALARQVITWLRTEGGF